MKVYPDCIACMYNRVYENAKLATKSEKKRLEVMRRLCKLMLKRFDKRANPSELGTRQSRIVMEVSGNPDPYEKKKKIVIARAKKVLPKFRKYVAQGRSDFEEFERALMVAMCGNRIEISAPHYKVDEEKLAEDIFEAIGNGLAIDDVEKIFERTKKSKKIFYLCDNAGEAVFDTLLINELRKYAEVVVGVASGPVDDDITLKEAGEIRFGGRVVGKGKCFGIIKEYATNEAWKLLKQVDLVFAKGMANYETLTDAPSIARGKTVFLLKVKCSSISKDVGAPIDANVAMFWK